MSISEFQRLSQSALREHIATVGGVDFILRGITYTGTRNELTEEQKLEVGQVIRDASATLYFPRAEFVPPLRTGEKVSFHAQAGVKAETMRIGHIGMDALGMTLTLQDREK